MNDVFPLPGGPCSKYPLLYGIPGASQPKTPRLSMRAKIEPTSRRVPLLASQERPDVRLDRLGDAIVEDDARQGPLHPRRAERAPLALPMRIDEQPTLLALQRKVPRLQQELRKDVPVRRERRESDCLPGSPGRRVHGTVVPISLNLWVLGE
jgi:hypothetical protein